MKRYKKIIFTFFIISMIGLLLVIFPFGFTENQAFVGVSVVGVSFGAIAVTLAFMIGNNRKE